MMIYNSDPVWHCNNTNALVHRFGFNICIICALSNDNKVMNKQNEKKPTNFKK